MRKRIEAPELGTLHFIRMGDDPSPERKAEFRFDIYAFRVPEWDDQFAQPRISFIPDDENEPPHVYVFFGADVVRQVTPATWLQFWWSYADPIRPGRLEVMGWDDTVVTEYQFLELCKGARIFRDFAKATTPGRPQGSVAYDAKRYVEMLLEQWSNLGRPPKRDEFLENYNLDLKTLKRNLRQYGMWPWSQFVNEAERSETSHR
jgi:hypothetical protein